MSRSDVYFGTGLGLEDKELIGERKQKRYLVVRDANTGFAEIANVGVFDALNPQQAREQAREHWGLRFNFTLHAYLVDELPDTWCWYEN